MSTAKEATIRSDKFLQHVSLKNYKSIKDVEISFKPGLNLIIGKNSSGKTNFINGLDLILNLETEPFSDTENRMKIIFNDNEIEIQTLNKVETKQDFLSEEYYDFPISQEISLSINDNQIIINHPDDLKSNLFAKDLFINKALIKYGIYYKDKAGFINVPFSFVLINNSRVVRDMMMVTTDNNRTEFIYRFFRELYISVNMFYQNRNKNSDDFLPASLKDEILSFANKNLNPINNIINNYSPIQRIRLNPDFNLIKEDDRQTVTNFYLEFLIDQSWLTFNLLSDGTKRLFYVISEVLSLNPPSQIKNDDFDIVLLEEPELGIHPHQLHQLMQFIKEQSKEKQIILTTHSPQVLDILESDELDRIIICHYDSEKGTQLSHLTDQQIKKAQKYMSSEAFLSDYWRFSDLEPA